MVNGKPYHAGADAIGIADGVVETKTGPRIVSITPTVEASTRARLTENLWAIMALFAVCRAGDCFDNAVAESFFGTLKTELFYHRDYETRAEEKGDIFEWIEVSYKRQRRHSALGYLSPARYEVIMENCLGKCPPKRGEDQLS